MGRFPSLAVLTCLAALVPAPLGAQETRTTPPALQNLSPEVITQLIESAKPDTPATVRLANREIVTLRANVIGRSPADRVAGIERLLQQLADREGVRAVASRPLGTAQIVTVDGTDAVTILPLDVDALTGETVESATRDAVARLVQALDEISEGQRVGHLLWGIVQAVLATIVLLTTLWFIWRLNRKVGWTVEHATLRRLQRFSMVNEVVRAARLPQFAERAITLLLMAAALSLSYLWVSFVLRRFPYTRPWGESLRTVFFERAANLAQAIGTTIPDLFTIAVILVLTRFAVRFVHLFFVTVQHTPNSPVWAHADTAPTTRKIVVVVLCLFAAVMAYPYIPGSDTEAFKGMSVLVGLMVSLGASGVTSQMMGGFSLTYSRALHAGDFVRIGDVEGTVTQTGLLSTKVETLLREEVTIPNAVVISQTVTNFSRHAAGGVYVSTEVTIGYDAPWRQVEALLLLAASRTKEVRSEPIPVVRQVALEDFYVRYRLLVCLEEPRLRRTMLSALHANIQDAFNEHGVQIMSPHYEGDPSDPKVVPPPRWFAEPAAARKTTAVNA